MNRLTDAELEAMRGHTPGPLAIDWNVSRLDLYSGDAATLVATIRRSTLSDGIDSTAKANARLFVAADALLQEVIERRAADAKVREALERAYAWLGEDAPEEIPGLIEAALTTLQERR